MDSRDSSSVSRDGNEDGLNSITAELAKEADVMFQARRYSECIDVLQQLLQKKDDPKSYDTCNGDYSDYNDEDYGNLISKCRKNDEVAYSWLNDNGMRKVLHAKQVLPGSDVQACS